jgi:genome maintenance exonuclease 1
LTTETINGQRNYVLPDGTRLKSVTTVLSEKMDKTALLEWKAKVGEAEATRISVQAARRGTAVHNIAERYILNEESYYGKNEMPINIESFKPIKRVLDDCVDNILGVELPLSSKALGVAGRTDLVAEYNGKTSIIDFKTSKRLKKAEWIESYFLQSTIYSMMFERMYSIAVPQIVIIITVDDEPVCQEFIMNRADFVDRALEVLSS